MSEPKGKSCGDCRFANNSVDYCWRYPTPVPTEKEYCCGEYEPENPTSIEEAAKTLARYVLLGDKIAAHALVDKLIETRDKDV